MHSNQKKPLLFLKRNYPFLLMKEFILFLSRKLFKFLTPLKQFLKHFLNKTLIIQKWMDLTFLLLFKNWEIHFNWDKTLLLILFSTCKKAKSISKTLVLKSFKKYHIKIKSTLINPIIKSLTLLINKLIIPLLKFQPKINFLFLFISLIIKYPHLIVLIFK
jgi:hypothetical protein